MTRKIKALGLALVASLALSVVGVSAASAAEFHSTSSHTLLSAGQTTAHTFTVGSGFGAIKCATAEFKGTSAATTTKEQSVEPHYTNCTDSFGRVVDVNDNGAVYRFTNDNTVHVEVPGGAKIELKVTSGGSTVCTVTVASQTNSKVSYSTSGSGVLVSSEVTNVSTTTSGGFFNCGVSDGAHTGGSYTGSSLTTGTNTEGKAVTLSYN